MPQIDTARLLEGRRCVVTSGAHGLGFTIARLFAQQGGTLAVCGRSASGAEAGERLRAAAPGSFFFRCDMEVPEQVEAFAQAVLDRLGGADVIVNNVGIGNRGKLSCLSLEDFDRVQQVNLRASVQLLRRLLPGMLERRQGSVVHVGSVNATAPAPGTGSYSASKGGVLSLSRVLAAEGGKYGVRSNVVSPGWIATTQIARELRDAAAAGNSPEEVLERYHGTAPLLSPARMGDIAAHVLFFASDMSGYLTGCEVHADGGAVLQAHRCAFPEPEDAPELRREYYRTIFEELGLEDGKEWGHGNL